MKLETIRNFIKDFYRKCIKPTTYIFGQMLIAFFIVILGAGIFFNLMAISLSALIEKENYKQACVEQRKPENQIERFIIPYTYVGVSVGCWLAKPLEEK